MISIVVPVFNVATFLPNCIESILNQSFHDIELILIDDGSTDTSGAICDAYALRDKRVVVEHTPNQGVAKARNTGTLNAKGEYICYIDADDWISKDYLFELYTCIKKYNLKIVQSGFYYAYDNYTLTEKTDSDLDIFSREEAMKLLLQQSRIKNFPWGKLIDTRIAQKHLFPNIINFEDSYWFYKILHEADNYAIINKPLYFYRQHSNSLTSKLNTTILYLLRGSEERISFIQNNYPHLLTLAYREYLKQLINVTYAAWNADEKVKIEIRQYINDVVSRYSSIWTALYKKLSLSYLKLFLLQNSDRGLYFYCKFESLCNRLFCRNSFIKQYKI